MDAEAVERLVGDLADASFQPDDELPLPARLVAAEAEVRALQMKVKRLEKVILLVVAQNRALQQLVLE